MTITHIHHTCHFTLVSPSCRAGGKAGAMRTCTSCNGRGIKISIRQIGPGMVQQMQSACTVCSGEGTSAFSFRSLKRFEYFPKIALNYGCF